MIGNRVGVTLSQTIAVTRLDPPAHIPRYVWGCMLSFNVHLWRTSQRGELGYECLQANGAGIVWTASGCRYCNHRW